MTMKTNSVARPDFSDYVAHFTSERDPFGAKSNQTDPAYSKIKGSAFQKLENILTSKTILATNMPWTNAKAVAFTECPWWSLMSHAKQYSPYGIGFKKARLLAGGGAPAIYMRPDMFNSQIKNFANTINPKIIGFDNRIYSLITPFVPSYSPQAYLKRHWPNMTPVDYSHEREWRVDHDFSFDLTQVEFVIVDKYEDVAALPKGIKDSIGREKFLIMDNYRQIERLWPTHNI